MAKRLKASDSLGGSATVPDVGLALHPRLALAPKSFVDFCQVPELGDVNEQLALHLDQAPILRGSPRRVCAVARALSEYMEARTRVGQATQPRLVVTRGVASATGVSGVRLSRDRAHQLAFVLAFGGPSVASLTVDGRELAPSSLPVRLGSEASLTVMLQNDVDEDLDVEVVACWDEPY